MLSWGKSQIRVQYISNMLFNWSMFCLGSVWILYCLTFLWIPSLCAWLMINVSESTFVLKIGAHSEGLHDWSGHCAQLISPMVRTCFPYKFSAVKSYPSTNYVQLCSSENVTQKVFFWSITLLPFPLPARSSWGSSPHFSLSLQYSVSQSIWAPLHFPPGETPRQFLCWELAAVLLSLLRETLWISQERLSASHHTVIKIYWWYILEKVVFRYHENSSEICTF